MQMRSLLVPSLAALTLAGTTLGAQAASHSSFGLLLGGNSSTFANVDASQDALLSGATVKRRTGFQVGAYLNRSLSSRFSIQPELHYIQRGAAFGATNSGSNADIVINLTYVEIPVLLRVDLGDKDGWRPFLTAGPTAALRIGCDGTTTFGGTELTVKCDDFGDAGEEDGGIAKSDFGASLGAGIAGKLGRFPAFAQLRFQRGLVSLFKDVPSGEDAPKTSMLSLVFGIGR